MVNRIARAGRGPSALSAAGLLALALILVVSAYYPFQWDPPRVVHNEVTRSADGALRFGDMNQARTTGTPDWLDEARSSGTVEIDLAFKPQATQDESPAPIMMLARDFWHSDFAIGQDHSELLVWLLRPGSDGNGNPALTMPDVLTPRRWNRVDVSLHGGRLWIDVNGARQLTEELPPEPLSNWGAGQVALGSEVHGDGSWRGEIRKAEVRSPGETVDYIRPGALSIAAHYLYFPDHVAPFPPEGRGEWIAAFLHFLSFIAVGFLLVWTRRPRVRPSSATVLALAFAVILGAGKFLFHGRHTEAVDIVAQTTGALLGSLLAWHWANRQLQEGSRARLRQRL